MYRERERYQNVQHIYIYRERERDLRGLGQAADLDGGQLREHSVPGQTKTRNVMV